MTSEEGAFDITAYDFSHTIMSFQRAVEHVQFLSMKTLAPTCGQTKTGSLYYLGCGSCRNGFRSRPTMRLQAETMDFLWQYMNQHRKDEKVQFETTPIAPQREALFPVRFSTPAGNTPQDRAKRYNILRVQNKAIRDGGS